MRVEEGHPSARAGYAQLLRRGTAHLFRRGWPLRSPPCVPIHGGIHNLRHCASSHTVSRPPPIGEIPVLTGRRNLEAVRQWVTDAAASVPPGAQRDTVVMQIARRGLDQLGQVVRGTNAELNTIAGRLQGLARVRRPDSQGVPRPGG